MKSFRDIFRPRKAPGTPEGGRFAAKPQSESQITLGPQMGAASRDGDITEEDGTYWVYAGDHYRDWYTSSTDKIKLEVSTFDETGITQLVVVDGRSPGYKELAVQEFEGDHAVEEAMAYGKDVRESALEQSHSHNQLDVGDTSPWGAIQRHKVLAPGIDQIDNSDRGGMKASPSRQEAIDPRWRKRDGWYEQDCAWSIPAITHHEDLDPKLVERAHRTARSWYPDEYEAVVGSDPAKFGLDRYEPITLG